MFKNYRFIPSYGKKINFIDQKHYDLGNDSLLLNDHRNFWSRVIYSWTIEQADAWNISASKTYSFYGFLEKCSNSSGLKEFFWPYIENKSSRKNRTSLTIRNSLPTYYEKILPEFKQQSLTVNPNIKNQYAFIRIWISFCTNHRFR